MKSPRPPRVRPDCYSTLNEFYNYGWKDACKKFQKKIRKVKKDSMRKLTRYQKALLHEFVEQDCLGAIFEDLDVSDNARHNEAIDVLCKELQAQKKQ